MTLKEFQLAQQKWCARVGSKTCHTTRNLESDQCAKCALKYLNSQAALEQFDPKAAVSNRAPKFATLSDSEVRNGLATLIGSIRSGTARRDLPVGARPVISGMVFEVVDHDTVKVEGREHTLTLRYLARDYSEIPFDSANGGNHWDTSKIREWCNGEFFSKLCMPLREVIADVVNVTKGYTEGSEAELYSTTDKVWLPSLSQLGLVEDKTDIIEGDVLDAFDGELTIDNMARRIIAEYHGDEIVPKSYWLRSSMPQPIDSEKAACAVDHRGYLTKLDTYETTAMVVPYITLA